MKFEKIETGNGFNANLTATTNNRLELLVDQAEQLNGSIVQLEATIVKLDNKNSRLQDKLFALTVVGVVLAALQLVQVIDIICGWFLI